MSCIPNSPEKAREVVDRNLTKDIVVIRSAELSDIAEDAVK